MHKPPFKALRFPDLRRRNYSAPETSSFLRLCAHFVTAAAAAVPVMVTLKVNGSDDLWFVCRSTVYRLTLYVPAGVTFVGLGGVSL